MRTLTAILALSAALCCGCTNATSTCYDEQLHQAHKDDICTADCPGVEGCDGKIYCNECEANRQGIPVKK
jgi:hypothetical protein